MPEYEGRLVYDFDEFCQRYGQPAGKMLTFEVTHNGATYIYAEVIGAIDAVKSYSI